MKKSTISVDNFGTINVESRGVNSQLVTNEVITFTTEVLNNTFFTDLSQEHDRDIVVTYIEHFFMVMADNDLVEQFDIIFDKRNNTTTDMNNGMFAMELRFKQKNCLNQTEVKFLMGGKK